MELGAGFVDVLQIGTGVQTGFLKGTIQAGDPINQNLLSYYEREAA